MACPGSAERQESGQRNRNQDHSKHERASSHHVDHPRGECWSPDRRALPRQHLADSILLLLNLGGAVVGQHLLGGGGLIGVVPTTDHVRGSLYRMLPQPPTPLDVAVLVMPPAGDTTDDRNLAHV